VLTKVDVTNRRGNVLSLSMTDDDSAYVVNAIEGLEPVQATLTASSYAGVDGEIFQSAKRSARNIKMKLDLDPDFITDTITTARQNLYRFFIPKSQINLRFYQETGLYLDITGIVEDFSAPLFDLNPSVDLSIMCYQPDFTDPRIIQLDGHTVSDTTNTVIDYPGNVESGVVVTLNVNRPMTDFTIYNTDEGGNTSQLDFTGSLIADDVLVISSLTGNKGITLTRAGAASSYLFGRSAQSSWIQLFEGLNNFRIYATAEPVPYVLEYQVRYGGL
jgi:Phage tail protein